MQDVEDVQAFMSRSFHVNDDVSLEWRWCAVEFIRSKMTARKLSSELMRQRTLHTMYSQQLALFGDRELQHNLAAHCSGPADLMRQQATFDELACARVVKLGVRAISGFRGLLLSR